MENDTTPFYDAIAQHYPRFYKDWQVQLEREGLGLRAIFRGHDVRRVLDPACGVGTQAVPLAELGYNVVAADPSEGMLAEAKRLAAQRNACANIEFVRAAFDDLPDAVGGLFDAIVCKGNALPHLLTDEAIQNTLRTFFDYLRPGGLLVIGMRDFELFMQNRPRFLPGFDHTDASGNEFISYEIWEWEDEPITIATQHLYLTQGKPPNNLHTIKRSVQYRPLTLDEVKVVLLELGYTHFREYPDRWEQVIIAQKPD